jgi:hypothetical protein
MTRTFTLLGSLLLLAGCATGGKDSAPDADYDALLAELTHQNGRACVRFSDISGAGSLGENVFSVSTSLNRKHYLVTTVIRCAGLETSMGVGFDGLQNEVCGRSSSSLVANGQSCPIKHIYEFPTREDALAAWEMVQAQQEVLEQYHVPK